MAFLWAGITVMWSWSNAMAVTSVSVSSLEAGIREGGTSCCQNWLQFADFDFLFGQFVVSTGHVYMAAASVGSTATWRRAESGTQPAEHLHNTWFNYIFDQEIFLAKCNFGKQKTIVKLIKLFLSAVKLPLEDPTPPDNFNVHSVTPQLWQVQVFSSAWLTVQGNSLASLQQICC